MTRALQLCLLLMVTLAIAQGQVFGAQCGFLCLDKGNWREMTQTHCHQNGQTGAFAPCENKSARTDCPEGKVSHHLPQVITLGADVSSPSVGTKAPAFAPALIADGLVFQWLLARMASEPGTGLRAHPPGEAALEWDTSVLVARCMVLLV